MAAVLIMLLLSICAFLWVLWPLFEPPGKLDLAAAEKDLQESIDRSIDEYRADLELGKIKEEDLKDIEKHLRSNAHDS
jgi:hypothetical protein